MIAVEMAGLDNGQLRRLQAAIEMMAGAAIAELASPGRVQ